METEAKLTAAAEAVKSTKPFRQCTLAGTQHSPRRAAAAAAT